MADISVTLQSQDADGYVFNVGVHESDSSTTHQVTVPLSDYKELTGSKITPADLVKKSFKFLLDREPKESILGQFDLREISRYFPEYEDEVKNF